MKTSTFLLLLLLFSTKSIAQFDCGSFENCLNVGIAAYQEENYEGAIGYLTNAINNWKRENGIKEIMSAYMYRGNSYLEMDSIKLAIRDYSEILLKFGKHPPAFRMRAMAHEKRGEYQRALNDFSFAIQIENNPDDYAKRGLLLGKIEKFDEAIKDLSKAIELNPKWVDYYLKRAQIYFLMEKYDEALKDASTAQDLNSIIPDPYTLSATIYLKMRKFVEAFEQINSAINFAPEEAPLYATRGLIYYRLKKNDEAIADLKKAADMGFDEAKTYLKSLFNIEY
ncbi:MAG: tetratricopeptide repeat protein [Bacteroidetes bacterium]|nr:tetratricopeptide repeat protein [Bacteroidota bacterium]